MGIIREHPPVQVLPAAQYHYVIARYTLVTLSFTGELF
jgi:hypothetical protein